MKPDPLHALAELFERTAQEYALPESEPLDGTAFARMALDVNKALAEGSRRDDVWDHNAQAAALGEIEHSITALAKAYYALHPRLRAELETQMERVATESRFGRVHRIDGNGIDHGSASLEYITWYLSTVMLNLTGVLSPTTVPALAPAVDLARDQTNVNHTSSPASYRKLQRNAAINELANIWETLTGRRAPVSVPEGTGSQFGDFVESALGLFEWRGNVRSAVAQWAAEFRTTEKPPKKY